MTMQYDMNGWPDGTVEESSGHTGRRDLKFPVRIDVSWGSRVTPHSKVVQMCYTWHIRVLHA